MRWLKIPVLLLVVANPVAASDAAQFENLYGSLLREYWRPKVTIHGIETTVFDYAAMQGDGGSLIDEITSLLKHIDTDAIERNNDTKAFWINVYNFAAMRMVTENYPVNSITSFKISLTRHPWSKKAINVGGQLYSLSEIEKEILLPRFNDPRIVFAVSCAAVSCPDRTAEPFTAQHLDMQLDQMISNFFRNPGKGLALNRSSGTLTLAWILKKDGHLFQDDEAAVQAFVLPYLDKEQQAWLAAHQVRIDYFEHDWTLNDLAQADHDEGEM